jgi:hypothetical protein
LSEAAVQLLAIFSSGHKQEMLREVLSSFLVRPEPKRIS